MQNLDHLDTQENPGAGDELQIKKEKITQGLVKLKERAIKYDTLQQQLDNTTDKQVSTTDPDSRSILTVKNIVEVAYNIQNVVDDKHNLIVHSRSHPYQWCEGTRMKQPHKPRKIYNCKKKTPWLHWQTKAITPEWIAAMPR